MTPFSYQRRLVRALAGAGLIAGLAVHAALPGGSTPLFAQQEPSVGRRRTPPQPQQKPGVEYLLGRWTFTWTGRESPLTVGPRSGTTTYTRQSGNVLEIRTEGKSDDTGATFKETGTAEWDETKKTLTIKETLLNGAQLAGVGDWSSPLSIRYESQPIKTEGETLRIRRTYLILSAHSYQVTEEMSVNGGPFVRLGNGIFSK